MPPAITTSIGREWASESGGSKVRYGVTRRKLKVSRWSVAAESERTVRARERGVTRSRHAGYSCVPAANT